MEPVDMCRPVEVTGDDGEPVIIAVHGCGSPTVADVAALGEIARAAQRRYRAEHPEASGD